MGAVLNGDSESVENVAGSPTVYEDCSQVVTDQQSADIYWEDYPDNYDFDAEPNSEVLATIIVTSQSADVSTSPTPTLTLGMEKLDGLWKVDSCSP